MKKCFENKNHIYFIDINGKLHKQTKNTNNLTEVKTYLRKSNPNRLSATITLNDKRLRIRICDLMAKYYLPKKEGNNRQKIEYINGDRRDCSLQNLRWTKY